MPQYSTAFKSRMLRRLVGPDAVSANALAQEVGVGQTILSRWLRESRTVEPMTSKKKRWTGAEKLRVVLEARGLSETDLGALLRREGLHEAESDGVASRRGSGAEPGTSRVAVARVAARSASHSRARARAAAQGCRVGGDRGALGAEKKSPGDLGGRGRYHDAETRAVIQTLIETAVLAGARRGPACRLVGLSVRTVERWRTGLAADARHGPHHRPANQLTVRERATVLTVINSVAFRDLSPHQIVPLLADAGRYLASESTIYRILREEQLLQHRGRAKAPVRRPPRAHVATGPNQLWSWDITYLRTPVRGVFVYLYLMLDVWSRKVVGLGGARRWNRRSVRRRSSSRSVARSGSIPRASCCTPITAAR